MHVERGAKLVIDLTLTSFILKSSIPKVNDESSRRPDHEAPHAAVEEQSNSINKTTDKYVQQASTYI